MQYETAVLNDYLVTDVEDPRINVQSILTRHFLIRALYRDGYEQLMREEFYFSSTANALLATLSQMTHPEDVEVALFALEKGSDNAEGFSLPLTLVDGFKRLPTAAEGLAIPNYLKNLLTSVTFEEGKARFPSQMLNTFQELWRSALPASSSEPSANRPAVLEPACGSANDFRFLPLYGLAERINYTGIDICQKNIENARKKLPESDFRVGNVFEIDAPNQGFELCFVHDLFEHLSIEGLERAAQELARVTRQALCLHFFNMDENREHIVRPVESYHWNTLSTGRVRDMFYGLGFDAQIVHIGTFLRQEVGAEQTHNPNAYTFILWRRKS